ncbi:SDR family oxidoreductase (plasmid) [Sphingomonas paeninsulae]|uniref:SDR family oxidoreductase n=1 Tax=Sphingomonas paeninsulae TaxID=2319844 RepID=A0A494T6E0_SPHPE|nr:SDR family oxidoreductase [Sphingomonas paeninsulae]AYJ84907.1 SDR family oxidoreductase [Sphingomonas paeninsulae]
MLEGKIILVTGGNSGIGQSIAALCAEQGAIVVVAARREGLGLEAVAAIRIRGGKAMFVAADISREDDVDRLFGVISDSYGRLDGAVNNAAIQIAPARVSELSMSDYDRIHAVNQRGVMLCLRHEMRMMEAARSGSIINISSQAGLRGFAMLAPYVATKHALIGLTRTAGLEGASMGVRVNCICPGTIETQMLQDLREKDPEFVSAITNAVPIGRLGYPDEIGNLAVWLLSSQASLVTCQAIVADGGSLETMAGA